MATTPADAALLLEAIAGVDAADPATVDVPLGDVQGELRARARRARRRHLRRPRSSFRSPPTSAPSARRPCARSTEAGARLVEVELPEAELILPTFRTIQSAEALETHRRAGLYPGAARRVRPRRARPARRRRAGDASSTISGRPPTASASAPRSRACSGRATCCSRRSARGSPLPIGEETVVHEGVELTFRDLVMSYTTPQDLVGLPACAVRAGLRRARHPGRACSSRRPPGRRDACCGRRRGSSTRRPRSRRNGPSL